jgi:ferredoxin
LVTSSFISKLEINKCTGCGKCASTCPVSAIEVEESRLNTSKNTIKINENICIGCGVCGLTCSMKSIGLVKRKQRVIHPEDTFERIILMCLERGTLQNQIFNDPQKLTHKVMRGFFGAFLRLPPVKKALMSDLLRSSFLASVRQGTASQGKAWLFDI